MRLKKILAAILTVGAFALAVPAAQAEFGFPEGAAGFDGYVANQDGNPATQAGQHPYAASTTINFNSTKNEFDELVPDGGSVRDVEVDLPPGLVGNPTAAPTKCTYSQLVNVACPVSSQVGTTKLKFSFGFPFSIPLPLYAMEPPRGYPAAFGFRAFVLNQLLLAKVRTGGDYGITIEAPEINQGLAILGTEVTIWGNPSDPSHDPERYCPGGVEKGCSSDATPIPFLTNPTDCAAGPVTTTMRADSWNAPGVFKSASFISHDKSVPPNPVGIGGCEDVPFSPSLTAHPTTSAASSPTGLEVEVHMPQVGLENSLGIAESHLKAATVALPEGMTVNPSSASGLGSCSASQIALDSAAPAACPDDSKIGSVEVETPLLDNPLRGGVYLAAQRENRFGSLLAIYLVAHDPETGVVIKLAGRVAPDPETGRLTTTFDDNPQLPFEDLRMSLFGGPRASLVTPPTCGTYVSTATFTPWAAADPNHPTAEELTHSSSSFEITSGPDGASCPKGGFEAKLNAGTVNPLAGAYSPLLLDVSRADGSQPLRSIEAELPEGVLAKLAGVPYCPEEALGGISGAEGAAASQVATPSCPAASQVGRVTVAAGAGPTPFRLETGRAYLAGPYKGAPLSLAFVVPALAGPFDLGNVVVRAPLRVDPVTARVSAVSDPLPTILYGIPLGLRDVRVEIERGDFTLNPTSCDPMEVRGTVTSAAGLSVPVSDRFQVGSCERLAFKPKLSLQLSGPTRRTAHPALKAVLKMPKGGANIGKAVVTLPETEFLENAHIRTICTRVQYAAENCPKASVYGYAKAFTPLLEKPLQGPVYLRSSNHKLPDLVADLNGQIDIDLAGRIDSPKGRIRNTFWAVPDAPVSKFVLTMQGGKKGLLVNNTELCRVKPRAKAQFTGQNGKTRALNPLVKTDCGKK